MARVPALVLLLAAATGPARDKGELRRGHEAFRAGDYEAAARALDPMARVGSGAGPLLDYALYFLAESEFYAGRPARAAELFAKLAGLKTSRFAAVAAWRAADARWAAGDHAPAAASYRGLLKRRPPLPADIDAVPARFHLAEQAAATGALDEARSLLRGIEVEAPDHPLAAEAGRRRLRLEAGEAAAAVRAAPAPGARAGIGAVTGALSAKERLHRAELLADRREYAAAVGELETLRPSELDPALAAERDFALGMSKYRMRRDYEGASRLLLGVVDRLKDERAATAAFHGARALSRAHRDDDAIAGYRRMIERFPRTRWAAEAQFLSGWLEINRGRFREGLPGLKQTIERYGSSPFAEDAAWFLALGHLFLGEAGEALSALDRYVKMASGGREAAEARLRSTYFRGVALAKLGRKPEALALWHELAGRAPLHYYGLLAAARLRAAGTPVRIDPARAPAGGAPPARTAANPRSPLRSPRADPALDRADALLAAGLDVEAGVELARDEPVLFRRLGADQGLVALLERYPRMQAWNRAYRLAEVRGAALLAVPFEAGGGALVEAAERAEGGPRPLAHAPLAEGPVRRIWEAAYPRAYPADVEANARTAALPPLFLWSIMRKESGFSPHDVSYADARGLLQMLPETSASVASSRHEPFFDDELFTPAANLRLGAAYIGALWKKFKQNPLVTAGAFNGGPKAMSRWCDQNGRRPTDEFVELVTAEQSREYIKRVAGIYARYVYLYEGRLWEPPFGAGCSYEAGGPDY